MSDLAFRPVTAADVPLLHRWLADEHSAFWEMTDWSEQQVADRFHEIDVFPHHDAWLGWIDDTPRLYCETYHPEHSPLAGLPDLAPDDLGMHVLVAPPGQPEQPDHPEPGFTRRAFAAVMQHCFDLGAARVVVEPDARNSAIREMNERAGFTVAREITLPDKVAALSFCTREAFAASPLADSIHGGTA